jgi:hypothetical protein
MQFLALFTPSVAFAQGAATNPTVKQLVYKVSYYVLNPLIKIGFVIALLYFMWGVVQYIYDRNSGHVADATIVGGKGAGAGADHIIYGLFGLFIMVSAFGLLQLVKSLTGSTIVIP